MKARAVLKYSRISPLKAKLVADIVRHKPAEQALSTLKFVPKKAGRILAKLIRSAVANAEQNAEVQDIDNLYISQVYVNEGPMLKRFRAAPMGRAQRIRKRTSHITVELDEKGSA